MCTGISIQMQILIMKLKLLPLSLSAPPVNYLTEPIEYFSCKGSQGNRIVKKILKETSANEPIFF
jgi:hypothetical protein